MIPKNDEVRAMLFDISNIQTEEDLWKKLDEIRTETMFKDREECLQIIKRILYYGVEKGQLNEQAVEGVLDAYREKLNDIELERLAALALIKNHHIQQNKDFDKLAENSVKITELI